MKRAAVVVTAIMLSGLASISTFAGGWQQFGGNWAYQNDDGSYKTDGWHWIGGKCYYFRLGIMQTETVTPDGYQLDSSGAWIVDGLVQIQPGYGTIDPEIEMAVARAKAAGAGSYQYEYNGGGWSIGEWNGDTIEYLRPLKDVNGMVVAQTGGIVMKIEGKGINCGGTDRSIRLANDPSDGNLQPNWVYNPIGWIMTAPPVISMDKNIYDGVSVRLTYTDGNGNQVCTMISGDTSGSWVYAGNPSGSSNFRGLGEELSGWMYRYADGSYAANGIAYIYENHGWGGYGLPHIFSEAYLFNENGFLITNSLNNDDPVDEYGRVCTSQEGPYGIVWLYTE